MKRLFPTLLTLACLLPGHLPASELPALGDASSAIVSPEQEHRLGRAWLSMLRGQVASLQDPLLLDYVESSVFRLAESSQVEDRRLTFILLDSKELNAFAAPGGIIGINAGLFIYAETEGEYASVLAHELAHLSQRHFARGVEERQQTQVPMMAAMLAGVVAAAAGAGDVGMAAIASSQAAAIQSMRRYSRQNEQEADRIGLINLEKAGYDPRNMPGMFERLMRQYRYSQMPPEFLLTHPLSEARVADTRNRAEQADKQGTSDTLRYQLMRARVISRYEESPGMTARRFRTQLEGNPQQAAPRYGLALALLRSGQFAEARSTLKPLLDKAPNDLVYSMAAAEIDLADEQIAAVEQRVQRLLQLFPTSYPVRQLQARLLLRQNRPKDAENLLDRLLGERPADSDLWYMQAETRGLAGNIIGLHEARAEYFSLVGDYDQALEQLDIARRRAASNYQLAARIDSRYQELLAERRMIDAQMH